MDFALHVCLTIVIMLVALVYNTIYLNGLFSTILIYFILLVAFYAFYEFFRYTTIRKFLTWNSQDLKKKCKKVYEEFTKKGETLTTMLVKEGITLSVPLSSNENKGNNSTTEGLNLGIHPDSIVPNGVSEDEIAGEAFVGLSGYKRIFFTLFILCVLSIVVIIVSIMQK